MLVLVIQIAADRYALDARCVREVVPAVALRPVPHAPAEVAGLATWRGQVTPVIDLVELLRGEPCPQRMSSRMVVVDYGVGRDARPLGLLAEQITDVERVDDKTIEEPGVRVPGATYLGRVMRIHGAIVQLVEVKDLLPDALRKLLWAAVDGETRA
ncbi:MAG TPA: chemotaxis protein CheW [Kofleriaceae bacterium]|nr:chemotaxis protein CheW [Kofleriaceae bacterium]